MNKKIEIILSFRKYLLDQIDHISPGQLNLIPKSRKHNIIWNLAHMNSVMQVLCYQFSDLPTVLSKTQILPFLPGTSPIGELGFDEIEEIKQQLLYLPYQLQKDFSYGLFQQYEQPEKINAVYGIQLNCIDDAIAYLLHHDGLHYASVMNIQKELKTIYSRPEELYC